MLALSTQTFTFSPPPIQQKSIQIEVAVNGEYFIDRVNLKNADLAFELQQRLWRSYMSNDRMPGSIELTYQGTVSPELKQTTLKSIADAQQRALVMLCLQKFKRKFEDIGSTRQERIRKKFPVLFQILS